MNILNIHKNWCEEYVKLEIINLYSLRSMEVKVKVRRRKHNTFLMRVVLFICTIGTSFGFNKMEQLAAQPMKPWMFFRECLAVTSSLFVLLLPGYQDNRT